MIDYKTLLRKYIQHVVDAEGDNFLSKVNGGCGCDVVFTAEEIAALEESAAPLVASEPSDIYKKYPSTKHWPTGCGRKIKGDPIIDWCGGHIQPCDRPCYCKECGGPFELAE